jgi:transposase
VIDGAMNGPIFLAYIEQCLAPTLGRRDIVIMDNLPTHKVAGVVEAIETVGASVLYLPSYSPDLNPIEQFFSKLKALASRQSTKVCVGVRDSHSGTLRTFIVEQISRCKDTGCSCSEVQNSVRLMKDSDVLRAIAG